MKQASRARTARLPTAAPRLLRFFRRAASTAATIVLGVAILTGAAPVCGRIRHNSSPQSLVDQTAPDPWTGPTSRPSMPGFGVGTADMHGTVGVPQMKGPQQKRALPERFLVVTGIIAYTDPKQGFAIIGNSVENTMLARPGQQLPDGAWIREIHPKNVILEHGGNLESVGIYRRDEPAGTAYPEVYPVPLQASPLPQQAAPLPQLARWEEPEESDVGHTEPGQSRPTDTDTPSSAGERRGSETPANELQSSEAPAGALPAEDVSPQQARPDAPLPAAPDPADELSDDRRRQHTESCTQQSTGS